MPWVTVVVCGNGEVHLCCRWSPLVLHAFAGAGALCAFTNAGTGAVTGFPCCCRSQFV